MDGLIGQILRFGVVGTIATVIDVGVYTICCNLIGIPYLISGTMGFVASIVISYFMNMRFVFKGKEGESKLKEFTIFTVLSIFGLGLNELILYICVDGIYLHWQWIQTIVALKAANVLAKLFATGIVMFYNFISRKMFLEDRG